MTSDTRRARLCQLAAQDLHRLEREGHLPLPSRPSVATRMIDVVFWLVYAAIAGALGARAFSP